MRGEMLLSRPKPELVVPRPTPLSPPVAHTRGRPVLGGRVGVRASSPAPRGSVGVRAASPLPALATAGPFPGHFQINLDFLESNEENPTDYIKVQFRRGTIVATDGSPVVGGMSGIAGMWLAQVRTARDRHEQNLEAVRDGRGLVYLRTLREVGDGEELLVWYGDELARESGIPVLTPANIRGEQQYACTNCLKSYQYPNQLKAHIRFRCRDVMRPPSSQAVEAYYRHSIGRLTDKSAPVSPFSPSRLRESLANKEEKVRAEDAARMLGQFPVPLHAQIPGMDPSLALSYYHPLYTHLYPHMAYYYHQMAPLLSGIHPQPQLSPVSPLTPGACDPSKVSKDISPVQMSPLGFPLPSETAGEPLDLLPRSLYTSKSRKGHLCIYCGKLYSRKYGLKIHLRTHTGYKPLKCKVCQRPFGDPSNLNKHIRLHAEGDTPYRCNYCGKVLVRRRDLERHIKSRHPDVTSTEATCPTDDVTPEDADVHMIGSDVTESPVKSDLESDSDLDTTGEEELIDVV